MFEEPLPVRPDHANVGDSIRPDDAAAAAVDLYYHYEVVSSPPSHDLHILHLIPARWGR